MGGRSVLTFFELLPHDVLRLRRTQSAGRTASLSDRPRTFVALQVSIKSAALVEYEAAANTSLGRLHEQEQGTAVS